MAAAGAKLRVASTLLTLLVAASAPQFARSQAPPEPVSLRDAPSGLENLRFLPDGKLVGSAYDKIYVWDHATGEPIAVRQAGRCASLVCSPDGRYVVDGNKVFASPNLSERHELVLADDPQCAVASAAFSRDGSRLAFGLTRGRAVVVDVGSWEVVERFTGPRPSDRGLGVGFSAPPVKLLVSWGTSESNVAVRAYDLTTKAVAEVSRHTPGDARRLGEPPPPEVRAQCGPMFLAGDSSQFAVSPSGTTFTLGVRTADRRGALGVWDAQTLRPRWIAHLGAGNVLSVAYSPDERFLVVGGYATDDFIHQTEIPLRVFDAATGEIVLTEPRRQETATTGITFSPDGRTMALSRRNAPVEFVSWRSIETKLK